MIILVTGSTAGFGEHITRRFVKNGHRVIATGRRQARLQALKNELGDAVHTVQLDMRTARRLRKWLPHYPLSGAILMCWLTMQDWHWEWSLHIKLTWTTGKT